ncbi:MAG: DUF4412 domain-containing protein [Thermoanaerobaculia bacterium]
MKKAALALVIFLVSLPASGGLTYDFKSAVDRGKGGLSGKAAVEEGKVRIEIADGDDVILRDGNVMISSDGGKSFAVLDQKKKTYFTLELEQLLSSVGAVMNSMGGMFKMSFTNHSVKAQPASAGETIEGYPTTKYVVDSSYDLTVEVFGRKSVTNVSSHSETWTTEKLAAGFATFVQTKGFKTGMEELDKFVEKETRAVKGFPLKQVTTMTQKKGSKAETTTTTVTVNAIKETSVPASSFEIPAGYKEVDSPLAGLDAMRSPK